MLAHEDVTRFRRQPELLLRRLLQFDTTNPPGNEVECLTWVRDLLAGAGIESRLYGREATRPSLVARVRGEGRARPLLLYGHVDVVTTAQQTWTHDPFAGVIADGCIWGRGTLDMKGGAAMMLAALLRVQHEGTPLPGDVILALVSDEERGGHLGAGYLTREHPELFDGVRFALGELGGFSMWLGEHLTYPIMIAEKQACVIRATVRGNGGHASMPARGGTMARLARMLTALDASRLPVHVGPAATQMITAVAGVLGEPGASLLELLDPQSTDSVLDHLGEQGYLFDPLLHNTVNATIVRGGEATNVIPSAVMVDMDGRLIPGHSADDLIDELHALLGPDVELEALRFDTYDTPAPDMGLFDTLSSILTQADPAGAPIPLMLPAVTDARYFTPMGIQTYGFIPLRLPPSFDFVSMLHAADERMPVDALHFGVNAMHQALLRFGEAR